MRKKTLGQYIVADPEICHGQPTFRGTRIRVAQVLKQVAKGMDWDKIMWQWRHTVCRSAIAEAVQLAGEAFQEQNHSASRISTNKGIPSMSHSDRIVKEEKQRSDQ